MEFIRREVAAAGENGLKARLLVPLTRPHGGAALQFEVELPSLDRLEDFRHRGAGSATETADFLDRRIDDDVPADRRLVGLARLARAA